jgi:hypothetical protein
MQSNQYQSRQLGQSAKSFVEGEGLTLKTSRLSSRDAEDVLEVLVQHIKKTVGETPKEEERGNEDESPD